MNKSLRKNQRLLRALILCFLSFSVMLSGCDLQKMSDVGKPSEEKTGEKTEKKEEESAEPEKTEGPVIVVYYDAQGNRYEMVVDDRVTKHDYDWTKLEHTTGSPKRVAGYDDGTYTIRQGVDVSHHNGTIDWKRAKKAANLEFAFLRLGYRGYGKEGKLMVDNEFQSSFKRARAAGLDLGVYFFSQAINEKEAVEEAKLVLRELNNSKLELPVVYDPEYIRDDEARTDNVTKEQFTKNTLAFCKEIEKAGYQPAIYSNLYCEDNMFDLSQLEDYPIWYADYKNEPQTPYRFTYWQYSESGDVPGIPGKVDLNVEFIRKKK